jgi:hypothetical protein
MVYAYTTTTGRLKELLDKIPTIGQPKKADREWLAQSGFATKNDPTLLNVLRFAGMIDSAGAPTEAWRAFRIGNKKPLAQALRESYKELFEMYENAQSRSDSDLTSFFKSKTSSGDSVVKPTVITFKTLCNFADFNGQPSAAGTPAATAPPAGSNDAVAADGSGAAAAPVVPQTTFVRTTANGVQVTINIQVALHETQDPEVYKSFFKAMKDCFLS